MKIRTGRRTFIRNVAAGSAALGFVNAGAMKFSWQDKPVKKVGIIGLDTSHSPAFAKVLNGPDPEGTYLGYKVVAAYPHGSSEIKSSYERIPGYTEDVKKLGVEITSSIGELLQKVDYVLLETNDGRLHLQQALEVMKSGKRLFIDKPVAASLEDTLAIFRAAEHYKVPVFSSSSLRYINGAKEISEGSIGRVMGADAYSPGTLEKTHPDLFWYGVHGVETLFTVMGTGCTELTRMTSEGTDLVTGIWSDGRIGTYRGIRTGKTGYGGTVFGEKGISVLGGYAGYNPLLKAIVDFFETGVVPVKPEETIEIFTFMAAAEESKVRGGAKVILREILEKAQKKAEKINIS